MMSRIKVVTSIFMLSLMIAVPVIAQGFDWGQFKGTTIVVNFPSHFHYNAVINSGVIQEFEKLTGIKVEVDQLQYMKMHDKQVLEMSKPSGDYDLIALVVMWKTEYVEGNMLTELGPMFADPKLAVPDYDMNDIVPGYLDNCGKVGGKKIYLGGEGSKLYAIPFGTETSFLMYRKDLFAKYHLKVPETYDDVRAAAKFFFEKVAPTEGVYGLSMRGASGHQASHEYLLHADPFGAKWFDENWEPAFTSAESIATLNFMKEMVKYGPPGIAGFDNDAANNAFLQGQAAMYIDANVVAGQIRDPRISKVVGKVGYALHPKQKTNLAEAGGFGIGIPANAKNKEAAFLFLQWLTMKDQDKKIAAAGGAPMRLSTVNDPELQAKFEEFPVLAEQLKYADPDWRPIIKEFSEIDTQYVGVVVNQVLTGEKSPEEAMQSIVEPVRAIMEHGGYYKK
jgi:multiple sugar transport system substrate-binding protein